MKKHWHVRLTGLGSACNSDQPKHIPPVDQSKLTLFLCARFLACPSACCFAACSVLLTCSESSSLFLAASSQAFFRNASTVTDVASSLAASIASLSSRSPRILEIVAVAEKFE